MKELGCFCALVGLKMADEVERGFGQMIDQRGFSGKLLNVVFSKMAEPLLPGLEDGRGGEHLGYGDEGDVRTPAAGFRARAMNFFLNFGETVLEHEPRF